MDLDGRAAWAAVIVNRDAAVLLDACLHALVACDLPPREIVVVENGSSDDSLFELAGWPQVVVEASADVLGFGAAANRGLALVETPVVALLQPEIAVAPNIGRALVSLFERESRLALAAPRIDVPGGGVEAGGEIERPLLLARPRLFATADRAAWERPAEVDFVPVDALALRRDALNAVGGFDAAFGSDDYQDADIAQRLRDAGWTARYEPSLAVERVLPLPDQRDTAAVNRYFRGRLRYAVRHLSTDEWATRFVPAEVARLRAAIGAAVESGWPLTTGASAIEELARAASTGSPSLPSLLAGAPLARSRETLAALAHLLDEHEAARAESAAAGRPIFRGRAGRGVERDSAGSGIQQVIYEVLRAQQDALTELTVQNLVALLDVLGQYRLGPVDSSLGDSGTAGAA